MGQLGQFITNHWALCLALIAILALIYINELISQKKQAKNLSTAESIELINHQQAVVMDLREADAFRAGHIIDAMRVSAEDFNQQRMEKYKKKPIILVCDKGIQSATLATKLRQQGFEQAMALKGGFSAWQSAGLPTIKK